MTQRERTVSDVLIAEQVTVTIAKGDVLGWIMLLPLVLAALRVIVTVVVGVALSGGPPSLVEWLVATVILATLAATGWGVWELAHWFTSDG